MSLTINKCLTARNFTDCNNAARNKYIVIHYVGALGGAEANCKYYRDNFVGASAHYYVGFQGERWQSVLDEDIAWHCGASSYVHAGCRNSNSIGIEICVRKKSTATMNATDKDWYFESATVASAIELTKYLMKKYNIPADRVIRHYDVTGKICPNPYVYNNTAHTWTAFKAALTDLQIKVGGKYKLLVNIYFRKTPSGEYVKWKELSETAKKKSTKKSKSKLKKGNTVKALEVKTQSNGNVWIRIKNGWLCVKYKGKYRVK